MKNQIREFSRKYHNAIGGGIRVSGLIPSNTTTTAPIPNGTKPVTNSVPYTMNIAYLAQKDVPTNEVGIMTKDKPMPAGKQVGKSVSINHPRYKGGYKIKRIAGNAIFVDMKFRRDLATLSNGYWIDNLRNIGVITLNSVSATPAVEVEGDGKGFDRPILGNNILQYYPVGEKLYFLTEAELTEIQNVSLNPNHRDTLELIEMLRKYGIGKTLADKAKTDMNDPISLKIVEIYNRKIESIPPIPDTVPDTADTTKSTEDKSKLIYIPRKIGITIGIIVIAVVATGLGYLGYRKFYPGRSK